MILKILEWDSNFFGIKTASLQANSKNPDIQELKREILHQQVKLIYVFEEENTLVSFESDTFFKDIQLVDRKVTYSKILGESFTSDTFNVEENDGTLSDELLELTYSAGKYSRFFVDQNMPPGKAKELYKLWIQRSVNGDFADKVYITKEKNKINGFITVKSTEDGVSIGLVAVDEKARGKGIGKTLIKKSEEFALRNEKSKVSVVTQLDNIRACKFYESCGFQIEKVENIYHIWL